MGQFKEFLSEGKIEKGLSWKEIVEKFDVIEDAIIQPDGKSIRVRGTKNNKFADAYVEYKNSKVAEEVHKRVSAFVGIK